MKGLAVEAALGFYQSLLNPGILDCQLPISRNLSRFGLSLRLPFGLCDVFFGFLADFLHFLNEVGVLILNFAHPLFFYEGLSINFVATIVIDLFEVSDYVLVSFLFVICGMDIV